MFSIVSEAYSFRTTCITVSVDGFWSPVEKTGHGTERNGTVRFTVPVLDATNGTVKMTGTAAAKKRTAKKTFINRLS